MSELARRNKALLLIDLQEWILKRYAPHHGAAVAVVAEKIRANYSMLKLPVVHVQYLLRDGTDGGPNSSRTRFVLPIRVQPGDIVLSKFGISAFEGTDLHDQLRRLGVGDLLLAGAITEAGVAGTARDALAQGFRVTIAADAVASGTYADRDTSLAELRSEGVIIQRLSRPSPWR